MSRSFSSDEEDWLPEAEIKKINQEKLLFQVEDTIYAEKLMREASPIAAKRLVQIAKTHPDANTALRAINMLLDRAMGKPTVRQEIKTDNGTVDLMSDVMSEVQKMLSQN